MCAAWLSYMRDMAHTSVWHHSFVCATRHIPMCAVTHLDMFHDSFLCVSRLRKCDETHSRTHTTLHFSVSRSLYKRFTSPINGLGLKWIHKQPQSLQQSCHTYQWVIWHISTSHGTYKTLHWRLVPVPFSLARYGSPIQVARGGRGAVNLQFQCVAWHILMNLVTHINESCHPYEWVMLHTKPYTKASSIIATLWIRHVTHINATRHTYQHVMSKVSIRHIRHKTLKPPVSHTHTQPWSLQYLCQKVSIRHIRHKTLKPPVSTTYNTHLEASSIYVTLSGLIGIDHLHQRFHGCFLVHPLICVHMSNMTHSCQTWLIHDCVCHASPPRPCVCSCPDTCDMTHSCVWHIHVCDMSHSCVWHDFIHVCNMTHLCVWHDSFMCVTWLIHVCDTTHSCVWHIHVCDTTHSCVWDDSFMCVTWLIHVCDMTHSCVWHDSFMCVKGLIHACAITNSWTCVTLP